MVYKSKVFFMWYDPQSNQENWTSPTSIGIRVRHSNYDELHRNIQMIVNRQFHYEFLRPEVSSIYLSTNKSDDDDSLFDVNSQENYLWVLRDNLHVSRNNTHIDVTVLLRHKSWYYPFTGSDMYLSGDEIRRLIKAGY